MNDTSGFYKKENENTILFAPNFVESSDCSLYRESKDDYSYPIDGWYWFDSREQAESFFNIPSTNPEENG